MKHWINFALLTLALTAVGSCSSAHPPPSESPSKPPKRHLPTDCQYLYNVGRSEEWRKCMGVGRKVRRQAMLRRDM